jgi:hypothetical protein
MADDGHKETPSIDGGAVHPFCTFYDITHGIVK